ncbi:hypothetical protein ES706_05595 [subsurface metagenome]
MIKSIIIRIAIVLAGIIIIVLGQGLFYYRGFYSPPPSEMPSYEHIVIPLAPSTEFSDNVSDNISKTVLIDLAHDNAFDIEELNVLTSRLFSRGLTIEFFKEKDDLEKELLGEEEEVEPEEEVLDEEEEVEPEEEVLDEEEEVEQGEEVLDEEEEELLVADVFVVVCPQAEFSKEERETIDKFVNNGGKLLLIADPTRRSKINSLSIKFGLIFEADYLYNMKEYDANFQNIFISEFKENEVTKKLDKIALYRAGSISSADGGIAFGDENTFSSLIETRKKLSPIALAEESKVLAIYDLTFITEPHNGILDNNQLIVNIADWLTSPAEEEEKEQDEEVESK